METCLHPLVSHIIILIKDAVYPVYFWKLNISIASFNSCTTRFLKNNFFKSERSKIVRDTVFKYISKTKILLLRLSSIIIIF